MARTTRATRQPKAKADDKAALTLLGSSVFPAEVEMVGGTVPLGTIVASAHAASGLSVEQWNAQSDGERDKLIAETIDRLNAGAAAKAATDEAARRVGEEEAAKRKTESDPPRMRAVLVVRAKQDRRRRAGFEFGRVAVELNAADLSQAQIDAILADPVLISSCEERPEQEVAGLL